MERRATVRTPPNEFAIRVGVPSIDREHMALVRHLDLLHADKDAHPASEAFSEVLSRLGRQINAHFDSEEEILRSCGMPNELVLEHIHAHTEILEQYARLNLALMSGEGGSREEALAMVRRWIIDHVLTHDVRINDYLSGATSGS